MGKLMRWLAAILLLFSALMVFILTPLGSRAVVAVTSKLVPGQLSYQHFSGTLIGPLDIEQLHYQHQGLQISVDKLHLEWHPLSLLQRRLSIKKLNVNHITIINPRQTKDTKDNSSDKPGNIANGLQLRLPTPKALSLPFNFKIKASDLRDIRYGQQAGKWLLHVQQAQLVGTANPDALNLQINSQLQLPQAITANLSLKGSLAHYQLQLQLKNASTHWQISGTGTPQSIQLTTPQSHILEGELNGQLTLNWKTLWQWQLQLNAKHLNLHSINLDWPRSIDLAITSSGEVNKQQPNFKWNIDASTTHNKLHSDGQYHNNWQAHWRININKLGELLPQSSGQINSQGSLNGDWPLIKTQGKLNSTQLIWQGIHINQLNSQWQLDTSWQKPSSFKLATKTLQLFNFPLQQAQINIEGTLQQQHITLLLADQHNKINSHLVGSWQHQTWQATLQQLKLTSTWLGHWQLQTAKPINVSAQQLSIPSLCMASAATETSPGQFCLTLNKQQQQWSTQISSHINLQRLQPLLPTNWKINIPLALQLSLTGNNSTITEGKTDIKLSHGQLNMDSSGNQVILPLNQAHLSAELKHNHAEANLQVQFNPQNSLQAALALPNFSPQHISNLKQNINGDIKAHFNDAKFIASLIPAITITDGQLFGNWHINGTLAAPTLSGNMNLAKAKVLIPRYNLLLEQGKLTAKGDKTQLNFQATALSGGQPITADGSIDFAKPGWPISIHAKGNDVLLINTKAYQIYASPNLDLVIKGMNLNVTGSIDIPKADIRPVDLTGVTTLPDDDVTFINSPNQDNSNGWQITSNLDIRLGKQVKINAMNLKGKLAGQLTLNSSPQQATQGNGRINIHHGRYTIFGRVLKISPTSGVIYRNNPLNNPYLNIQAYSTITVSDNSQQLNLNIDNVRVGTNIAGTASSPQFTFFSSPTALSQTDILSYLVLGTPSGQASPATIGLLLQAVQSMRHGNSQAMPNSITNRIKQSLGFSELGVETETELDPIGEPTKQQNTYVVIGRRITPRLSIRYRVDPFSSDSIVTLYYLLTRHLRIQTDSSNLGTGGDILYTINRKSKEKKQ